VDLMGSHSHFLTTVTFRTSLTVSMWEVAEIHQIHQIHQIHHANGFGSSAAHEGADEDTVTGR
jgi:hypothetical protein